MKKEYVKYAVLALAIITGTPTFVGCYAYPKWRVWEQSLAGEAKLRESEWSRKVVIEEASAKMEASKMLAQAEVERATKLIFDICG